MAKPTRFTKEIIDDYVKKGYWNYDENVSDTWIKNAKEFPDKEALVDSTNRLTWGEVGKWIDRISLSFLELGLKKDDALLVQLPNSVELAVLRNAYHPIAIGCRKRIDA